MHRRTFIAGIAAALSFAIRTTRAVAADIQVGATVEVRANSVWFEDAAKLARWQDLQKRGNAKALASYEEKILSAREAWQFTNPLTVKIIGHEPAKRQVKVELLTPGRLVGTTWFLDASAFRQ